MFKAVQQAWNGLPGIAKGGIGIAAGVTTFVIVKRKIKKAEEAKRLKEAKKLFEESLRKVNVTDSKGNVVTVNINTATAATKVYDAIHNNDIFGWTEDETAIVDTLKAIPKPYIPDVENNYMKLYKLNMRQEVIAALDNDEWAKVDYLFN
jgi:transcriptional regulator with PAS, ATPase and Fis domain